MDIPEPKVLDLLDLLCCYNSQDPKQELEPEERFFVNEGSRKDERAAMHVRIKTWRSVLGVVYNSFPPSIRPPVRPAWLRLLYSTLAELLVKHSQAN